MLAKPIPFPLHSQERDVRLWGGGRYKLALVRDWNQMSMGPRLEQSKKMAYGRCAGQTKLPQVPGGVDPLRQSNPWASVSPSVHCSQTHLGMTTCWPWALKKALLFMVSASL